MITVLAWIGIGVLAASGVGLIVGAVVAEVRARRASADDEPQAPKDYVGVHRHGAVREPYQPPTWTTALAEPDEPSDALTEPTQAMPLVELRGEIGRHSSRQLGAVKAGPGWAEWSSAEWRMRNEEVFGGVDAT